MSRRFIFTGSIYQLQTIVKSARYGSNWRYRRGHWVHTDAGGGLKLIWSPTTQAFEIRTYGANPRVVRRVLRKQAAKRKLYGAEFKTEDEK